MSVPADVVDVHVSGDHQVDGVRGETRGGQPVQQRGLQVVGVGYLPGLVVADAGVDQDALAVHLDREDVNVHREGCAVGEVGLQPGVVQVFCCGIGQQPLTGCR